MAHDNQSVKAATHDAGGRDGNLQVILRHEQSLQPPDGAETSWLQRGIVGLVGLGPPETAGILPHEGVMPGLVAGRRELMAATQANLEPIFLIYDGDQATGAAETATAIMDRVA